jgi:phospholipid/cholesterol/gamma-HCH transport system permease protein
MFDTLARMGRGAGGLVRYVGGVALLGLDTARRLPGALFSPRARMGRASLAYQMIRVGVSSIPVVSVVSIFIGIILQIQMTPQLRQFGAEEETARVVGLALVRELGPLVSSLILAGFSGAAVAAELGTMVVSEEIDALVAGAMNPVRFLVVPRVTATVIMVTVLAIFADLVGLWGAYLTGTRFLGLNETMYISRLLFAIGPTDILSGIIKAAAFGTIIGLVACYEGLRVTGGAEGVGRAATRTVVTSGVSIIAADCLLTTFFYVIGWV